MLRRIGLYVTVTGFLLLNASPAFCEANYDVGGGYDNAGNSNLNVNVTESHNTTGTTGSGTQRLAGFSGVITPEFPPAIVLTSYIQPADATGFLATVCDGSTNGTVAPNVVTRCLIATNTITDATPNEVVQFAKTYFNSVALPIPAPEISAPNGGICGVTHSLNLHIPVEKIYQYAGTQFGDVNMHVYGDVAVNWGDGSKINHYKTGGAPYPNSPISHAWTTKGFYNITTTVNWIAVVTIGPYNGQTYEVDLNGLTTQATLPNFRVWDAQAVITQ